MPAAASISRRQLLKGRTATPPFAPRPPGVTEVSVGHCTGCAACVEACPQDILSLSAGRVRLLPELGECLFCGACAEACPEPVFDATRVMAHRVIIDDNCLARADITCMACRDACPESAIIMRPRIGGPFLPKLDDALCIGCGACIALCPGQAITYSPLGGPP
ncbi:ferredoxin-type protein NapF [Paracoccus sp. CPCC 101403]|uniref:Ferredoxin-type protein NapF n=1 Tax=Paracoccus broussonetiae TaxID=3075834 RepID=A0ABU3EML8_9RHOB|nr:ferredoxin-type protein NapF [Paracoccus sp. CPCC 101403]MDT1064670.1 ferredoxin-type protein NapF [Paracoccus sp. CPCC 101403]